MRHGQSLAVAAASGLMAFSASPAAAQQFFMGSLIEVAGTYCPRGFADASGQILSIAQNQALFSLLGTTYGGNGTTTFALPDVRGRMVIGDGQLPGGSFYNQGQIGGTQTVTLTLNTLPAHVHPGSLQSVATAGNDNKSFRNSFAVTPDNQYKIPVTGPAFDGSLQAETVTVQKTGTDGVAFNNMSPFLVTRTCIALLGIYPSRN